MNQSIRYLLVLMGICSLLLLSTRPAPADSPDDNNQDIVAVAKTWLALIDAGKYDQSYAFGCNAFHDKIAQDKWLMALKTLRTPLGGVVNRSVTEHTIKPNGVQGLNGKCAVITYDTSFAKADGQIETVVLKWEGGKWLGAGYSLGPKPSQNPEEDAIANPTTTTTDFHAKPPAQPQPH